MRKFLFAALSAVFASGIAAATVAASAAPQVAAQNQQTTFTCAQFQNPTVEFVWSHVCHF